MPLGMLGKYERLDVLGHGASGIVYLAKDTLLGKQVALKELSAEGNDRERVLEEARVLDRLRHPNIVQVNGVDVLGGKVIIDMEYIRGKNLQDILRDTPQLPVGDALSIMVQVCDGLAFAHERRTVHRDVKPANIIVTQDGTVKLVDFGLAEVLGTHSFAGGAGTYAYMAPEDFHEDEQSDRQSDIWSVGIILFETLAGFRPFRVAKAKDPFSWKRAIEEDPIPDVPALRPDVTLEIQTVIERALARNKNERYQNAGSLAADLRATGLVPPHRMALAELAAVHTPEALRRPTHGSDDLRTVAAVVLSPDFPAGTTIEQFLERAPDSWITVRNALLTGQLSEWLRSIMEEPLAQVADELSKQHERSDDERVREFFYRAGIETTDEARHSYQAGMQDLADGRPSDAVTQLLRASRLDPNKAHYRDQLSDALRASGDIVGAERIAKKQAVSGTFQDAEASTDGKLLVGALTFSVASIDFGQVRQGVTKTQKVEIRHQSRGLINGRVVAAPAWVRIEPVVFRNRGKQSLIVTLVSDNVWHVPEEYNEEIILETDAGRVEIPVSADVQPSRLSFLRIAFWFVPLLLCCLAPAAVGLFKTVFHSPADGPYFWEPGTIASGLLFGSLFVIAMCADTSYRSRAVPFMFAGLAVIGGVALFNDLSKPHFGAAKVATLHTLPPIVLMLVLQGMALAKNRNGIGRWQLWRWLLVFTALLTAYLLAQVS